MKTEKAIRFLYVGHIYEVLREPEAGPHTKGDCGFCAVVADTLADFDEYSLLVTKELEGVTMMHPLMQYLIEEVWSKDPPKEKL